MKKLQWTLVFVLLVHGLIGFSQDVIFHDSVIPLNKSTDFGVVHWYTNIENTTSDTIALKWVHSRTQCPEAWVVSWDDKTNYNTNLQAGDSAVFALLPNQVNKCIIGVQHNGYAGFGRFTFDFSGPNAVSGTVHFDVTISKGSNAIEELVRKGIIEWNPSGFTILTPVEFSHYNKLGRKVQAGSLVKGDEVECKTGDVLVVEASDGRLWRLRCPGKWRN